MTEEAIKDLPLDSLFDLMIQTFGELLHEENSHKNVIVVKVKKKDMELIQRAIIAKAVKLYPVDQLLSSIFSN
jgi:hypothetical protein